MGACCASPAGAAEAPKGGSGAAQLKVYGVPLSANCCAPIMLAMELKVGGMEYVDLQSGAQKKPEFLAINPAGTVPALEDGSTKGGESNAILRYLAVKYGPKFYPVSSPPTCYKIDFAMDDFMNNVYPTFTEVVYVGLGFKPAPSSGTQAEANKKFGEAANTWLARHVVGKFGLGDQISLIEVKALPYFFASMQPVMKKKLGFTLSAKVRTYVDDIMKAMPEGSKFLQEGDFSLLKFCAGLVKEGEAAAPETPEEPFTAGSPVTVGQPGQKGSVKIHALPPSQNACSAVIMAMEAGAGNFELCDLMSGANKKPEYLAINPGGQIPGLEDGTVKGGESLAILRYLALSYAPSFYPQNNPGDCYRIDFAMDDFVNNVYKLHVEVAYPVFGFKQAPADQEAANKAYVDKIEKWMKDHVRGPFVLGSSVSIADVKVVPFFYSVTQPAVKKNAGFVPPPNMEKYVNDIMQKVGGTKFMESAGGFAIKEYLANK